MVVENGQPETGFDVNATPAFMAAFHGTSSGIASGNSQNSKANVEKYRRDPGEPPGFIREILQFEGLLEAVRGTAPSAGSVTLAGGCGCGLRVKLHTVTLPFT